MWPVAVTLNGEERLKRLQRLDRALKADGSWLAAVHGRGLRYNGANEVVSQDVSPDLPPYQLGRLATQDVHLQRLLERAQIEFSIPACAIKFCQVAATHRLGIQQR